VCREMQQQGRLTVYGYVLLEDRFHLVASADDLGKEIDALKSATTGRIIESLRQRRSRGLLGQLNRCQAEDQAEGTYRLWEDGDPPELIQNKEAMQQKLEFIHRNPVERGYATDPTDWQYSSARDYAGQPGGLPVATDW
jgi:putative transposase